MKKCFVLLVLLLALSVSYVWAEDSSFTDFYEREIIQINFEMFGGLGIAHQGYSSSAMWGIGPHFNEKLSAYPESAEYLEAYNNKLITGHVLLWGGMLLTAGMSIAAPTLFYESFTGYGSGWDADLVGILTLGGFLVELIGAFLIPSSYQDLTYAVNTYNRLRVGEF